jgi:prophage antirepressor-like protein
MSNKHKNIFFMEIFNNILKINNDEVMIIFDIEGNIWFALRDVIKSLNYKNIVKAISNIKISKQNKKIYKKIEPTPRGVGSVGSIDTDYIRPYNIKPHKLFINESGLYEILSLSTKPLAKLFMDKYFTDIMPKIRKTGSYTINKFEKIKLNKINKKLSSIKKSNKEKLIKVSKKLSKKIKSIKKSNKDLLNNQRNIKYPIGNSIYIITKKINKKKYYKVGYTSNLNKRLKVYNTGEPNKILFNYYILVNNKEIDRCVKNIMHSEEFIKNKEYYMTTLNKVLKFINKCDNRLNKIYCGYCKSKYYFNDIQTHICKYL